MKVKPIARYTGGASINEMINRPGAAGAVLHIDGVGNGKPTSLLLDLLMVIGAHIE